MQFSKKLDGFTLWFNGTDFGGTVTAFKPPELTRKAEERRAGGMPAPVKTVHGFEELSAEITIAGVSPELDELARGGKIGQHLLSVRGHIIDELSGESTSIIHEMKGRAIKFGNLSEMKADEDVESTIELSLVFYKFERGGEVVHSIDIPNDIVIINGVNESEPRRAALGRA